MLNNAKKTPHAFGMRCLFVMEDEEMSSYSYDPKSLKAEEFINHEEILESLDYAEKNKNNKELLRQILDKAKLAKGISHKEAAVLMQCDIPEVNEEITKLAMEIKEKFYGQRIVMFAPLYLSNYCVNGCTYCPYHYKNKHIPRIKLTQEQIRDEVIALQDMGHKRLAIEAGEDPVNNPLEYILESIETIYSIKHKNGAIRRVNVNIAATTVENYTKLKNAGIGTYILFQETYNKESYEQLHPTGPKHDYAYHTEAMDRAMEGGIDDVGLGVLFGLEGYMYELVGILMHAEHLEAAQGVGPHTISVPRICPADDIDTADFSNAVPDEIFEKIGKYYYDDPAEKKNGEFYIVTQDDRGYIFYEAKFRKDPVTESIVQNEIRQVEQTSLKCYKYGFFSKGGFTCEKEENRILIELSELYR